MRTIRPLFQLLLFTLIATLYTACSEKGLFGSKKDKEESGFEGRITYKVEYDLPPQQQQAASMLPDEERIYIKNGKSRLEREVAMGAQLVMINDPAKDSMFMLLDAEGLGAGPSRVPINRDTGETDIEYMDGETKEVAGKECKKAVVTTSMEGQEVKTPVWYSEAIAGEPFRQFKGIKGLPLKFNSEGNGFKIEKEASEIVEEEVPDSLFNDNPKGYTTRSLEELQQMLGGAAP